MRRLSITGCHGEMYLDIVLVHCHQTRKQKTPTPNRKPKKHNRGDRGGGSHPARSSRCTVRQASHGSPMLAIFIFFPFFDKKGSMGSFAALRWLLEVFLAVEEFVGFRAGWPASISMITLNLLLPCWPPCPS